MLSLAAMAIASCCHAQSVTHVRANTWMATDFSDPANPGCSVGSDGSELGSRVIMGVSLRRPSPVALVIRRTSWSLPTVPVRLQAEFPDGTVMPLTGHGHGQIIDVDLDSGLLPAWIHMLTSGAVMKLTFGGTEPPWVFDLTGTTKVVNAMGDCLKNHNIAGVPAPFTVSSFAQGTSPTTPGSAPSFTEALSQMGRPQPGVGPAPSYAAPVAPAPVPAASVATPSCAAIASAQERLSCYDRGRAPAAPAPAYVAPMPAPQASPEDRFLSVLQQASVAYSSAGNEMQAGGLRASRAKHLCEALPGGRMVNWIGTVSALSSDKGGSGVLEITLAPNIVIATSNNAFSDAGSNTLIKPGSALFDQAAALAEGRRVRFTGLLLSGDDDCFMEVGLTQRGSMTTPKFIARFDSISPE